MKYTSFIIGCILLLMACKNHTPQQLLVGNWQFNNILYQQEISPENKPLIEANIASLRQSFSLEYHADNTYHSHSIKDEIGKWKLNEAGTALTHTDNDGEQHYQVVQLTSDSLSLKTTLQAQTLTLQFIRKKWGKHTGY